MEIISRILSPQQYADPEFVKEQETAVMLEIAAFITGSHLLEGDEQRITRHAVVNQPGGYVIFWDGIRKGVLYSGPELERRPGDTAAPVWLIFFVPEEDLQ